MMILDSGLLFWATLYTRGTFTEISKKSHRRVVGLLTVNKCVLTCGNLIIRTPRLLANRV